jgi:hypothetical protein
MDQSRGTADDVWELFLPSQWDLSCYNSKVLGEGKYFRRSVVRKFWQDENMYLYDFNIWQISSFVLAYKSDQIKTRERKKIFENQ